MISDSNANQKERFKELRERLSSQTDGFSKKELKSISKTFAKLIKMESSSDKWNLKAIQSWESVLSLFLQKGVAKPLGKTLPTVSCFKLGEFIASSLQADPGLPGLKSLAHHYLDFLRTPSFRIRIYGQKKWEPLILELVKASRFSLQTLFSRNARQYKDKTLFRTLKGTKETLISWKKAHHLILKMQAFLNEQLPDKSMKISFLMKNSPTMALLDLACLFSGRINIMIPANSTPEHISFILKQTETRMLIVSDSVLLEKIKIVKPELNLLDKVVFLPGTTADSWVVPFVLPDKPAVEVPLDVDLETLASVMYTSGTTGEPKGIMFNHLNMIYKRFCRALAIPQIGPRDRFLCYLPLFHTFGRFFEMTGSLFWGAEYTFMENPSVKTMASNMRQTKPTVFISIPRKWIQLYELISSTVNLELAQADEIKQALNEATGGSLKWGLSAAGYLPPDIFHFFQQNGVELMSGFGMTEATGGITMTPPGEYRPNSLGKALPGIEIKLADDGELLIRGPYVTMGYYHLGEASFLPDGWLPTGDIMKQDKMNCLEIIDRKKEIYKNVKGETVAPQKIENLFRDYEEVGQVFLVGDHRPYNTVLIYPNQDKTDLDMSKEQVQEFFSSVVVTVNRFLSPYERILDFRLIDREISAEYGELTPKNTFKRGTIEKNFCSIIETMYEKLYYPLMIDDVEVRIPNWFLIQKGILNRDIQADETGLKIEKHNLHLVVQKAEPIEGEDELDESSPDRQRYDAMRVGDYVYRFDQHFFDFQALLVNPLLWCGNESLYSFCGRSILQWQRNIRKKKHIHYVYSSGQTIYGSEADQVDSHLKKMLKHKEKSSLGIHLAIRLLQSEDAILALNGLEYLQMVLIGTKHTEFEIVKFLFYRPQMTSHLAIRRKMLVKALSVAHADEVFYILKTYLEHNVDILDNRTILTLVEHVSGEQTMLAYKEIIDRKVRLLKEDEDIEQTALVSLINLLTEFGIHHPSTYKQIRRTLVSYQLAKHHQGLAQMALKARKKLQTGFRTWLNPNQQIAVRHHVKKEYTWEDALSFYEDIDEKDRLRLTEVIKKTPLLKETLFLLTNRRLIDLNDILPGGIWISHLRTLQKKSTYRVSVQTRYQGAFDFTLNINKGIAFDKVLEEVDWLIMAGSKNKQSPSLVGEFGAYYAEQGVWSEEFLEDGTLAKYLRRTARHLTDQKMKRLVSLWPYFIWNAASAYYQFWKLTGCETMIAEPGPENIIIPYHDYQTGTKLISLTKRVHTDKFMDFFQRFNTYFIEKIQDPFPFLREDENWKYFFSAVISVEGENKGLLLLQSFRRELIQKADIKNKEAILENLNEFLNEIKTSGFNNMQLTFAIRRFHRWYKINQKASLEAQAQMLNDLYEGYSLHHWHQRSPDTRTRFFLHTVLEDIKTPIQNRLLELAMKRKNGLMSKVEAHAVISKIVRQYQPISERDTYFLTRLGYPHLTPSTPAELLDFETNEPILLVQAEDLDGSIYSIREPVSPKEISKLHKLFLKAKLPVQFRPDHQFLVAVSERGFIIGGLFYHVFDQNKVHMEKIVVANHFRRKGISEGLMKELFNRLQNDHIQYVTTGFFRPEYFYRFGFKTKEQYSGLVKTLFEPDSEAAEDEYSQF
ncbi:MAG: hypothetical protein CSA81_08670 [Acidobacteria bacterium]|nr:MAG: hypothetical protein CSA81_08670 [Acidobacteriota bacterium]